jgi:hypothetical protein
VERYYLTDTWTEENRDAYFPAAHISNNDGKNKIQQSRYLQNAGYIRLKNLRFGYDLPNAVSKKIAMNNV